MDKFSSKDGSFVEGWKNFWKGYFNFKGTATRPELLWGILIYLVVSSLSGYILKCIILLSVKGNFCFYYGISFLVGIAFFIPLLALNARRLRALGVKDKVNYCLVIIQGALLFLLPGIYVVYSIILSFYLIFKKTDTEIEATPLPEINFKNKSRAFKLTYDLLVIVYLFASFKVSVWEARFILSGAGPWAIIFTFGLAFVIFLIPEIIFFNALKVKTKKRMVSAIAFNGLFYLFLNGLLTAPRLDGDEGGVTHFYAFNWRQSAAFYFAISIVVGIALVLMCYSKRSLKQKILILTCSSLIGLAFAGITVMITQKQKTETLTEIRSRYRREVRSVKKEMLTDLADSVTGVHEVKFAVLSPSEVTLKNNEGCDSDRGCNVENDVLLIELNGKQIKSSDYYELLDSGENNSKQKQELATKYGIQINHDNKKTKVADIQQKEVIWNQSKFNKFQAEN